MWFRAVHIVNAPRAAKMGYQLMLPLLNERLQNLIVFHDSHEELHQHVDRSILPKELGGEAGNFDNSESAQAVLDMQDFFQSIKRYVYHDSE